MSEGTFEKQTVSIKTVITWAGSIIVATFIVAGAWFKLDNMEKTLNSMENRVHNIEEKVVWKREP